MLYECTRLIGYLQRIIDAKAIVDWTGPTLNDVTRVLANDTTAPTQSTLGASQHRRNQQRDPDSDSSDNEEPIWPQPLDLLKRKMSEQQTEYEKLSKRLKCVSRALCRTLLSGANIFPPL